MTPGPKPVRLAACAWFRPWITAILTSMAAIPVQLHGSKPTPPLPRRRPSTLRGMAISTKCGRSPTALGVGRTGFQSKPVHGHGQPGGAGDARRGWQFHDMGSRH